MIASLLRRACAALVLAVPLAVSSASRAAFAPQKPVELVVHTGPGGGNDVLARAIVTMVEKENLLPVRLVVVNKPGGNGAVAAAYLAEKKGDPHVLGLITSAWIIGPMTTRRGEDHRAGPDAGRAARARAGARGRSRGCAVQDDEGLHRRGEGEAGRAQAVRRLADRARQHHAAGAAERDRRALGVHLVSRRRRAHCRAARRPRQHDDHRAAGGGREHPRRQDARARAGCRQAACRVSPTCRR